jgi:hypothetical protein
MRLRPSVTITSGETPDSPVAIYCAMGRSYGHFDSVEFTDELLKVAKSVYEVAADLGIVVAPELPETKETLYRVSIFRVGNEFHFAYGPARYHGDSGPSVWRLVDEVMNRIPEEHEDDKETTIPAV